MGPPDAELAALLAERAGRLLLELRARPTERLGGVGDRSSHEFLARELATARPDDLLLSEEGLDDTSRLTASRVWIVDPLDGTREYAEPPRTDWAVHVALWADGELVAGAVALPGLGEVFGTARPPALPPAGPRPVMVVSRSRAPRFAPELARRLGAELTELGSAGAKVGAVLRGEADVYVHAGGMYEWDSAAPVAVARAAGLHASRIDGSPLRYNQPDPLLPDLLVCRPQLAAPLLAELAELAGYS